VNFKEVNRQLAVEMQVNQEFKAFVFVLLAAALVALSGVFCIIIGVITHPIVGFFTFILLVFAVAYGLFMLSIYLDKLANERG
jgi:hypothetical protein